MNYDLVYFSVRPAGLVLDIHVDFFKEGLKVLNAEGIDAWLCFIRGC